MSGTKSELPRSIVHLDADAFFASVEQAADARLRGKPIAVGGEKRGIIASASYEARKFGVYTPMPSVAARRLCPKLIILPGDFEKYELFSRLMFSYAYDFTPDVEIGSIDEGYFDLTGTRKPAVGIAQTIRKAIRQSLKLSVSEGIGSNKLISQIASKLNKPAAFQSVPHGEEARFLFPLANKWLPGVGPKTANQLNAAGLARVGQIAATPADLLGLVVGSMGPQLRKFALGVDERPIIPARAPAKSYGEQETFASDTTDESFIEATLRRMADKLMAKVRQEGKSVRTVTVKIRYNDMQEQQASESLLEPTDLESDIYSQVSQLLRKAWERRVSLRLVSLRLSNVYDERPRSALAFDVPFEIRFGETQFNPAIAILKQDARERLAGAVDKLREKFGRQVVLHEHDFILRFNDEPAAEAGPRRSDQIRQASPGRLLFRSRAATQNKPEQKPTPTPPNSLHHPANGEKVLGRNPDKYYGLAVVERQRLGHYAARQNPENKPQKSFSSPAPELHFRSAAAAVPRRPAFSGRTAATYIPLNVHSYYSFLDSTLSIQEVVELARAHELPAIALTDQQNLHGAVEFAEAATKAGIKPVIGAEVQWHGQKVCLYAQNSRGYRNLCVLLSKISQASSNTRTQGTPALPSVATEWFGETEGLIATSRCAELAALFPDRFYFAVKDLDALRHSSALPCVLSFPIHYATASDRWKYDVVQSIRTLTLLRQAHPEKRLDGEFHFRAPAELTKTFASRPDVLRHTHELVERCSFEFTLGKPQFPSYTPPDRSTPGGFLRRLLMQGLQRRYPNNHASLKPQLEEELAIILDVGYEEYFLVMWDILQECRRRGIEWITRGSAADSLACYCLEISDVCPIRFELYFRRFLNKDRMALNKLPDIDVDFPHDRKDDVINLIFEKYGSAHAAIVGGFSTFQSRSAFAEVAKVLGVSEYQVRRLTERFPHFSRTGELAEALNTLEECRDLPMTEEPYQSALQMAQFLDGFPRYPKMHPCGLVLSRQPMHGITPCFLSAKGYPTTHFDMDSIENLGLIKMDILAQGGLAVMRDVQQMLGRDLNLKALEPWRDSEVWTLIADGNARAVHHIESPAMVSLCKMCNVRDIDTLIAIVSVIRPGAANESKKMEFARRYQGLSPVQYPHPSLEPCLRSTYGLVVYEEHILQICEAFAGLPPGRADVLRRALAKDRADIIAEIQNEFAACGRKLGRSENLISEVWDLVTGFKGYAFCKAHSTAYGVEAYQSAWLKRNFPAEFMAGVLTNGKGFYSPLVYVLECHRLGIPLQPPWINEPGPQFTVSAGKIRVPALNVKGLTNRTKDKILEERARGIFSSLHDFILRVQPLNEEMQVLIQAGAFDEFGETRTTQYWEFKAMTAGNGSAPHSRASAPNGAKPQNKMPWERPPPNTGGPARPSPLPPLRQFWLLPPESLDRLPAVPLVQPERLQRLKWEEELLGYAVSGHPLELYPDIAWETYCPINRLAEHIGQQIVTCGLVIEQRLFHQITGEPMKFLTIADWTGMTETELFARTYKSYGLNTVRYRVLEIAATVEPFENGRGHTLRVIRASKPRHKGESASLTRSI